jgi:RNA polymerase sigma-70 factor (ECF subfamily)
LRLADFVTPPPDHDKERRMDAMARTFERWLRQGDLHALGEVFDALAPRLLPVAMHLCGNAADAEDALQQTFLLAMDRDRGFDAQRRLEPWLAGLLQNVVRNQGRREGRRRAAPLPECASDELGPLAAAEREELVARLRTHVDALPAEQRQVVRLQLQHGLGPVAIAEALELSPGTVRMRLHRGLETLRKLLPASLAALLASALPARGLDIVKHELLAAAATKVAAATAAGGVAAGAAAVGSAALVGGTLAMKKLVALLLLVGVAGAMWWISGLPPIDAPAQAPPVAPSSPTPIAAQAPHGNAPAVDAGREAVVATATSVAAPADEPTPTQLWGIVVDAATRAPIAGADVQLQHCVNDEFWSLDLAAGERIATLARARSDREGRFRFDVERARPHRLHVVAGGYATTTVPGQCGGSDVVVALTRGASVRGVVQSKDGPLADMEVRIAVRGESIELARGRTDANGAFRFAGLSPAPVFVQVSSPRFEEEWKQLALVAGTEHEVMIEMDVGKTLRGRVLDAATSQPVAAAEVTDSWVFRRVVRTDAEGRFELAGLRDEGFSMVHVRAHGYTASATNVAGRLGDELVVRLQRGGEVIGRVVDAAGKLLPDAYVAVCASYWEAPGMMGSDWIPARVGGDGRFQALALRPDQHYSLLVRRAGFGARVYVLPRMLAAGERHDVGDIVMQRGAGIEGRVVDDADQPIEGVAVSVRGTNADSRAWLLAGSVPTRVSQFEDRSVPTDARGVFRIADLAAGNFEVEARMEGRERTAKTTVTTSDGTLREGVLLVLPRGKSIAGTLLLATGLPPGDLAPEIRLNAANATERHSARIAADGSFQFHGLADATYTLAVTHCPKGSTLTPLTGVKAGATDVRIVLEAAAAIAGRVVDADGKPKKARVWARIGDGASSMYPTDDDGSFRLDVPATWRGTVGAMALGEGMQAQAHLHDVTAGRTDLVLKLEPPLGARQR